MKKGVINIQSGYIVDIIEVQNTKFPPFTKRELDIDKWVNGDEKDVIYNWNPTKVEKKKEGGNRSYEY